MINVHNLTSFYINVECKDTAKLTFTLSSANFLIILDTPTVTLMLFDDIFKPSSLTI